MELCHKLIAGLLCVLGGLAACLAQQSPCHAGWDAHAGSCYLFHSHDTWSWIESQDFCQVHGAHLATIETADENNFIKHLIKNRVDNNDDIDEEHVWIGGSDDQTENTWLWIGTDAKLTFSNWGPSEPNGDPTDETDDCIILWSDYDYEWADLDCHTRNYYICEKRSESAVIIG